MSRLVVKVGGRVAEGSATHVLDLVAGGHEVCVVHGAGPQISAEMERAGIPVAFVGGRRVTTPAGIEIVQASFAAVSAALCDALGERATPVFANEIGFEATRTATQLGLVGEPFVQRLEPLIRLLAAGRIPVVAPLAVDDVAPGTVLNVNADDASTAIALGLQADRILFLTDVEGFMVDGEVVETLDIATADELLQGGTLDPRILPKLQAARDAAVKGVPASIGRTEVLAA